MRKTVALLLVLVLMAASCQTAVEYASAEEGIHGSLTVESPTSQIVYNDTMPVGLTIDWSVSAPIPWMTAKISYSIDNGPPIAITNDTVLSFSRSSSVVFTHATCVLDVSNLATGKHRLNVIATGSYNSNNDFVIPYTYLFAPIIFHVRTMMPPEILLLSPQNRKYNESVIPLIFAVDVPTSWIGYSLDNQNYETIDANTTLTGLTDGSHSLVIYANDTVGNTGVSETIIFTVDVPEPFPTTLVATASVVSLFAVSAGLLVYFKKRRR